ncbi:MAG: gamma-glutamylcyclotransferase [Pseudomonadota bacterium]
MPFDPHVFRHMPHLRDLITPPDRSEMRFGQDRLEAYDAQAREEGWAPGWRMACEDREANRRSVLAGRPDEDLWVFGYGSLIWDPAVYVDEYRMATLEGWRRSFCMRLESGRGSRERPGLMAALDAGGRCEGVVMRIPAALVERETEFMWRREMFGGAYRPIFQKVVTPQGDVDALVFVIEPLNHRYSPDLPEDRAARMIAVAEGSLGPNFDYLDNLVSHLCALGVRDEAMIRLRDSALRYRGDGQTA